MGLINKAEQIVGATVNRTLKTVANAAKEKVLPAAKQQITQVASSEASMAAKAKVECALNVLETMAGKLPDNIAKIPDKIGKKEMKLAGETLDYINRRDFLTCFFPNFFRWHI